MATFKSDVYTAQIPTSGSANVGFLTEQSVGGKQRYALCQYTTTGSEVTADTLKLVQLPKGAKVIASDIFIATTATLGTGVTVRIGDGTTANRWAGTIDISAGGRFLGTATAGTELVQPVALTAATDVTLTFVAITAITASKVIYVQIPYILP